MKAVAENVVSVAHLLLVIVLVGRCCRVFLLDAWIILCLCIGRQ